jgi:hypothetical protein
MQVAEIKLYEILKLKLGEKEADALVQLVQKEVESTFEQKKEQFITAADKEKLLTKADALAIFATKEDMANLRAELKADKAEMIKWMFIFWASQLAAIFAFLKFFK